MGPLGLDHCINITCDRLLKSTATVARICTLGCRLKLNIITSLLCAEVMAV
jgi:hypothetical protein